MIGLRTENKESGLKTEEEEIVEFVINVAGRTRMHFNINVGIFIPKPHTPFQWAAQLDTETALKKLEFIRFKLKPMGHKVSISDPVISRIEGLLSRGDEKAGLLCEQAWQGGSRLDAWNEFINKDKWLEIFQNNSDYVDKLLSGAENFAENKNDCLPWSSVSSCVSNEYLRGEYEKSTQAAPERTPSCREKCCLCGVCKGDVKISHKDTRGTEITEVNNDFVNQNNNLVNKDNERKSDPHVYRVLFSFTKKGSAVFHGHLSLIEIFSMSFRRAGIAVKYTEGFNPLAKMEFASPLTTGVSSENEIAIADFNEPLDTDFFISSLNKNLPEGIVINRAEIFMIKSGEKKHSLSSLLWGFSYISETKTEIDYVNFENHKVYKNKRFETDCGTPFDLLRSEALARNVIDDTPEWASYFEVYRHLYKQ